MSQASSFYVHGTDPEEQGRLSLLNDILNAGSLRELALQGGESILDLGCGLGQLTMGMAGAAGPNGRVLAIDRSEEQLAEAQRRAAGHPEVTFRQGDVLALELGEDEWGSFDVAHTRFLLEHLPEPLAVVKSMVRAVRPGGRVVLEDEDHEILRLWPEPEGFAPVWTSYIESYRRAGNDPTIGKRLVELLHQAGAQPRRSTFIYFGACAGEPVFPPVAANLLGVLRGAKTAILAGGIEASAFEHCLAAVERWGRGPHSVMWYAMAWAEGLRPE